MRQRKSAPRISSLSGLLHSYSSAAPCQRTPPPCPLPTHRLACIIETPFYAVPMVLVGARAEGLAEVVNGTAPLGPEVAASVGIGLAALLVFFVVMRHVAQAGRRRVEAADATRPSEEEPPASPVQSPAPEPVCVTVY